MLESFLNLLRLLCLETLIKSLLLFLAAGIALLMLRRASAAARSLVWRLTLFGLIVLPALSIVMPPLPISLSPARAFLPRPIAQTNVMMPQQPMRSSTDQAELAESPAPPDATAIRLTKGKHADVHPASAPIRIPDAQHPMSGIGWNVFVASVKAHAALLLFAVWIAGFLVLFIRMLLGLQALRRLEGKSVPASAPLRAACAALALEMGVRRDVRICVAASEQTEVSPMTWGTVHPLILLPHDAGAWSEKRIRAVLLHELAHIARKDWLVQIVAGFVRACYWFHPLVWLMARQIRCESEQACDDRVLACGLKAQDYAAHLLEIVRMRKSLLALPYAATSMAQSSLLETRLRVLLDSRRSRRPLTRIAALLSLLGLACFMLPLAAARVTANHAPAVLNSPAIALPETAPLDSPVSGRPDSPLPNAALPPASLATVAAQIPLPASNPAIAWGKSVRGLQAGLEIAGSGSDVSIGQHVTFVVHLRNTGKKQLTLHYPAIKEKITANPFVWNAVTQNGKKVTIYRENTSIDSEKLSTLSLSPGEERTLPGEPLMFRASTMGNSTVVEQTVYLEPGPISVQAGPFPLSRYRDNWLRSVTTGTLHLNVSASFIKGTANLTSTNGADKSTDKFNQKPPGGLQGIHWGVPEKGLEAGIRIEGDPRRFSRNQAVHVTSFVRNITNHRLPFAYAYRPPRVWDGAGKPVETSRNEGVGAGLPGAILLILPPGETLALPTDIKIVGPVGDRDTVYSSLVNPAPGKYRVGQMFQIPWAEMKNTQDILDKNDPIYRTHVTLLNSKGAPYTARAVVTGADGVGIDWNKDHAPTPEIGAIKSDETTLWTGVDEFEVVEKGEARRNEIKWGKVSDGIQAGIRINGLQKEFFAGGRVPLECYIRNTTEHEIAFTYTALYYESQLPTVIDTANPAAEKKVMGVLLTGLNAALTIILKPGETVVFPHPGLGLGEKQEKAPEPNNLPKGLEQFPYLEDPTPGSYKIKQTFVYNLTTVDKARDLMTRSHNGPTIIEPMAVTLLKPDGTTYQGEVTVIPAHDLPNTLTTGESAFSILAKKAALERRSIKTTDVHRTSIVLTSKPKPASADTVALEKVEGSVQKGLRFTQTRTHPRPGETVGLADSSSYAVWGEPVNGLSAGLSLHAVGRKFALGQPVSTDLYWKNTTRKSINVCFARFQWYEFDPNILDANGKGVPFDMVFVSVAGSDQVVRLKPGEVVCVGHPSFTPVPEGSKRAGSIDTRVVMKPGRFKVRFGDTVQHWPHGEDKKPENVPVGTTPLSGWVEFEIGDK